MNIQIFGTKKCNDTKKAERFFKERGIKYQFIDMKEKGMSKGEFTSVAQANGGLENMVNWEGKDQDTLALIKYIAEEDKLANVLQIGYQNEPTVTVRFVCHAFPLQDKPEYHCCEQAGIGIYFTFYGTEPEGVAPCISQGSHQS